MIAYTIPYRLPCDAQNSKAKAPNPSLIATVTKAPNSNRGRNDLY